MTRGRVAPTLIDHATFGKLRLAQFFPRRRTVSPSKKDPGAGRRLKGDVIVRVEGWEFDDRIWVGEVIGFTEFLRPSREADVTRAISVELEGKRATAGEAILAAIGLPLTRGLSRKQVERLLGKPKRVAAFVVDRETLEFRAGSRGRVYIVDCTVVKRHGLTYVSVRNRGR